jgi:CheY-like chemotaxis protein
MTASSLPRQQLLLVDDEEDALLELAELLEGEGFVCHTATSVKLALHHLTRHPDIALVITDLRMPEESGMSLIKRLREHRRASICGDRDLRTCRYGGRQRHAAPAGSGPVSQADLPRAAAGTLDNLFPKPKTQAG